MRMQMRMKIGTKIKGNPKKGLVMRVAKLEKALMEKPGDQKLLWKLAVAYRNTGEYDRAIETLKELEGQMPHPTAKVAVLLAQCLKAKGDKEAAPAELEKLLESPTTVPGAVYAYKGILKEELGEIEEASEEMEKARQVAFGKTTALSTPFDSIFLDAFPWKWFN